MRIRVFLFVCRKFFPGVGAHKSSPPGRSYHFLSASIANMVTVGLIDRMAKIVDNEISVDMIPT